MITTELEDFLTEWHNNSPTLVVHTSGSTGIPKAITVSKQQMLNSARMTCDFLGLQPDDKALLCMPVRYIAGKMMVVRALYAGLDLLVREPSGHPMADISEQIRFAAMTPMQVYNSLQEPDERERLMLVETLIIGGGAISASLEKELQLFPNRVFSTYGMTETLSHIALRRLNGSNGSLYYKPLPGVKVWLSDEQTLCIDAPEVCTEVLQTNDIAELKPNGEFRILGRKDNIINSGGVKIQIESVEERLHSLISANFAITAVPDDKFGELVVLLIASDKPQNVLLTSDQLATCLNRYEQPKQLLVVDQIPATATGKTDRAACKQLARKLLNIT